MAGTRLPVLAWLADVEADVAAGRLVTLDDGSQI